MFSFIQIAITPMIGLMAMTVVSSSKTNPPKISTKPKVVKKAKIAVAFRLGRTGYAFGGLTYHTTWKGGDGLHINLINPVALVEGTTSKTLTRLVLRTDSSSKKVISKSRKLAIQRCLDLFLRAKESKIEAVMMAHYVTIIRNTAYIDLTNKYERFFCAFR